MIGALCNVYDRIRARTKLKTKLKVWFWSTYFQIINKLK